LESGRVSTATCPAILSARMSSEPQHRPERLDALTGFRFFAALAVVWTHVGAPPEG